MSTVQHLSTLNMFWSLYKWLNADASRQWIIFFSRKILRHLVQAFLRCRSPQEIADFIIKSALNSILTVQLFGKLSGFEHRQVNTLGGQVVLMPKNSCENLCSFLLTPLNTSPTGMYELFHTYSRGDKGIIFLKYYPFKNQIKDLGLSHTVIILTVMIRDVCLMACQFTMCSLCCSAS